LNVSKEITILVPARSGSKRIANKNLLLLGGKTLIQRAVQLALSIPQARVMVSTDSEQIAHVAKKAGAEVPSLRPRSLAEDSSLDIEWVTHAIETWGISSPFISILRPTSPLLTVSSFEKAFSLIKSHPSADSIRAVRRVGEHPGKMWRFVGDEIVPLLPQITSITPSHSRPSQTLEPIFVQCGSFEIAHLESVRRTASISGQQILGYELLYPENIDINHAHDFREAEFALTNSEEND
jgi:CMP-N,N'-diacetyllegionaminic acid synthase